MLSRDPARLGVCPPRYEEFADTRGNKRGRDCLTSIQKPSNSNAAATIAAVLENVRFSFVQRSLANSTIVHTIAAGYSDVRDIAPDFSKTTLAACDR